MDLMREIHPATAAALSGPYFHPVIMVWLDWPGGEVRAHSGAGVITWGGHAWNGVGQFGAVSIPEEAEGGVPADFEVALVCDLPDLAEYADAVIRQRPGEIWLGVTTERGGNTLIGAPVSLASGVMDTLALSMTVEDPDGQPKQVFRLAVGMSTGPGYRTAAAIHHSHEDQSRLYPGDTAGKRLVLARARADKLRWPAP